MSDPTRSKRKGKRLLVAALGVATVSYLNAQGCTEETERFTSGNLVPGPPDFVTTGDGGAADAARIDTGIDTGIPTSGNLLPPPVVDTGIPTSGNLLPPPAVDASADAAKDAALDTGLPTSGNLLPPPPDAAVDAGKPKDAQVKDALPPVGNLLPPAPQE
jgi:hypothetical protein